MRLKQLQLTGECVRLAHAQRVTRCKHKTQKEASGGHSFAVNVQQSVQTG